MSTNAVLKPRGKPASGESQAPEIRRLSRVLPFELGEVTIRERHATEIELLKVRDVFEQPEDFRIQLCPAGLAHGNVTPIDPGCDGRCLDSELS